MAGIAVLDSSGALTSNQTSESGSFTESNVRVCGREQAVLHSSLLYSSMEVFKDLVAFVICLGNRLASA